MGRRPPLHERRVNRQSAQRPQRTPSAGRRRAPDRRLTSMNVATATNFEAPGADLTASEPVVRGDPSSPSDAATLPGGDANPDNTLNPQARMTRSASYTT